MHNHYHDNHYHTGTMNVTIGMPTHDDYDGVYFSIMSALHQHGHLNLKFVVVDDNPTGKHAELNSGLCKKLNAKYVANENRKGSAGSKNEVFRNAEDGIVICIDSHVQIQNGGVDALISALQAEPEIPVIAHGPLIYDGYWFAKHEERWKHLATHWNDVWSGMMQGQFALDERVKHGVPFEIEAQGMGMFACWRKWWLGFSPLFQGFGGEERYIHDKFRRMGGKAICVPGAGWTHRFERANGVKYLNSLDERVLNYLIGRIENQKPFDDVVDYFRPHLPKNRVESLVKEAYNSIKGTIIQCQ